MSNAREERPPGPQFRNVLEIHHKLRETPVGIITDWTMNSWYELNGKVNPFYKRKEYISLLTKKSSLLSYLWEAEEIIQQIKSNESQELLNILYYIVGFLSNHPCVHNPLNDRLPNRVLWNYDIVNILCESKIQATVLQIKSLYCVIKLGFKNTRRVQFYCIIQNSRRGKYIEFILQLQRWNHTLTEVRSSRHDPNLGEPPDQHDQEKVNTVPSERISSLSDTVTSFSLNDQSTRVLTLVAERVDKINNTKEVTGQLEVDIHHIQFPVYAIIQTKIQENIGLYSSWTEVQKRAKIPGDKFRKMSNFKEVLQIFEENEQMRLKYVLRKEVDHKLSIYQSRQQSIQWLENIVKVTNQAQQNPPQNVVSEIQKVDEESKSKSSVSEIPTKRSRPKTDSLEDWSEWFRNHEFEIIETWW